MQKQGITLQQQLEVSSFLLFSTFHLILLSQDNTSLTFADQNDNVQRFHFERNIFPFKLDPSCSKPDIFIYFIYFLFKQSPFPIKRTFCKPNYAYIMFK